MEKYLEIGACSMLDNASMNLIIDKLYHIHKPEYYSNLSKYESNWMHTVDLESYSGFIFSQSIRDKYEFDINNLDTLSHYRDIINLNVCSYFNDIINLLNNLTKLNITDKKIILLSSISATISYKARPIYAATKAFQSKLFEGLSMNYSNQDFIEFRLGSVSTRMCNHGLDSTKVSEIISNTINTYNRKNSNHLIYEYK